MIPCECRTQRLLLQYFVLILFEGLSLSLLSTGQALNLLVLTAHIDRSNSYKITVRLLNLLQH